MRRPVDAARAAELLRALGWVASAPATVYLVGGSSPSSFGFPAVESLAADRT